jgi:hypothetical protein
MVGFSCAGSLYKELTTFTITFIWSVCFVLLFSINALMYASGTIFHGVNLVYLMRFILFASCFATASFLFLRNYCKRVVNIYLDSDTESVTYSQFMKAIKSRSIRYIKDGDGTRYMRAVTFTLTKEESILVESMIASLESNKVK